MDFIVAQILGVIAPIMVIIAAQAKTKKGYLLLYEIAYALFVINMVLLKGYAGAINNAILIFLTIIANKYENKKIPRHIMVIFLVIIIICNFITFQNLYSILPAIASIIYLIILMNDNMKKIRKYNLVLRSLWIIYDFVIMAYTTFILDIISLISTIVSIIKYDKEKDI